MITDQQANFALKSWRLKSEPAQGWPYPIVLVMPMSFGYYDLRGFCYTHNMGIETGSGAGNGSERTLPGGST